MAQSNTTTASVENKDSADVESLAEVVDDSRDVEKTSDEAGAENGKNSGGAKPAPAEAKTKPVVDAGKSSSWRSLLGTGPGRIIRVLVALALVAGVAGVCVLGYMVASKNDAIDSMTTSSENAVRAEKMALDYATGAANMDYRDLGPWNKQLIANTSPELASKLTEAASSMEQVITPLQWTSSSRPIAAQVKSHTGPIYVVNAFVSVTTKNVQAPDGVQSTATYTVTLDSSKNWVITDVGGIDTAVGAN